MRNFLPPHHQVEFYCSIHFLRCPMSVRVTIDSLKKHFSFLIMVGNIFSSFYCQFMFGLWKRAQAKLYKLLLLLSKVALLRSDGWSPIMSAVLASWERLRPDGWSITVPPSHCWASPLEGDFSSSKSSEIFKIKKRSAMTVIISSSFCFRAKFSLISPPRSCIFRRFS